MEMNADDRELHALEQELHTDLIPGTEIMTDIGTHHFVKGGSSNRVLVPQPSADPSDPLNWSTPWKTAAIVAASFATFTQGFGPLSLAPINTYYTIEYDCSLGDAIQFTGVAILVLGFSNFIWVPISTAFGRRPAYILSQIVNIASAIWRAQATSYSSFLGACVLNGIGAGPGETLQPAVIADIFFLHERGRWNTLYWVTYMGSLMVGPIISGSMTESINAASFWYLYLGMLILSVIMLVFMFPETKYHRPHPGEFTSASPASSAIIDEKAGISTLDKPLTNLAVSELEKTSTGMRDPYLGKGRPTKSQFALFQPQENVAKQLAIAFVTPWRMMLYPIVQFASFVVSWSCSSFLTLNLTQNQVFAAPPYNWASGSIGFTNFAILAGAILGLFTAGPLSDWVSDRATKRNRGVREPEMRLPAMIPYVIVMIIGNVVTAVGYQYSWPWQAIVIIGYGAAGLQVAALPAITSTYAVDSYKPVAGSLFVSLTVNKNLWGYGLAKFITPWILESGYIPPIMTNMALITLWCLFGILFYYKGKTFRRWTKDSSVHLA